MPYSPRPIYEQEDLWNELYWLIVGWFNDRSEVAEHHKVLHMTNNAMRQAGYTFQRSA